MPEISSTPQELEKTHGTDPPSWPSEGNSPADTLVSDFQPPELWDNKSLWFKAPSLWHFVIAALANQYRYQPNPFLHLKQVLLER